MDPFLPDPQNAAKSLSKWYAANEKKELVFASGVEMEEAAECTCTACPFRDRLSKYDYCCQSIFLYPLLKKGEMLKAGLLSKLKDHGSTPCVAKDRLFTERLITEASTEAAVALHAYQTGHEAIVENEAKRYGCYRVIIASLLGPLGRGCRVRLPACMIEAIRQKWPSADGQYTGFKLEALFDE